MKKIWVCALLLCGLLALSACIVPSGGSSDPQGGGSAPDAPEPEPAPAAPEAVQVTFEHIHKDAREYAIITGFSAAGETMWTVQTATYDLAQLARVTDIGIYGHKYYYVEGGTIVTLSLADGSVIWKNGEFGGGSPHFAMGPDDTLYISGYLSPDLFVVDAEGNTLYRKDHFKDGYNWPYLLELSGDTLTITYEMNGKSLTIKLSEILPAVG